MKIALEVMQKYFEEYDLKINWEKTKSNICQKTQQRHRLRIQEGNNHLEQVNRYKYLGSLIT